MEYLERGEREIGFCLAPAGRKPQQVHALPVFRSRVCQTRNDEQHERQLEGSPHQRPCCRALGAEPRLAIHRCVGQGEGCPCAVVRREDGHASPDATDCRHASIKIGLCSLAQFAFELAQALPQRQLDPLCIAFRERGERRGHGAARRFGPEKCGLECIGVDLQKTAQERMAVRARAVHPRFRKPGRPYVVDDLAGVVRPRGGNAVTHGELAHVPIEQGIGQCIFIAAGDRQLRARLYRTRQAVGRSDDDSRLEQAAGIAGSRVLVIGLLVDQRHREDVLIGTGASPHVQRNPRVDDRFTLRIQECADLPG